MAQQSSQAKTCMTCKEVNPPEFKFCGKCGAPLHRPQVPPTPQSNSQQEKHNPKTLVCPQCGNTNAYEAENCLKCGLELAPIRAVLSKSGASKPETPPTSVKPKEPAPALPELPARPTEEKVGNFVDSWRFLIRGMGDRSTEVAAHFFRQLEGRGIEGLKLSTGKLVIQLDGGKTDSRDYYFAERDLGQSALATMAIRIASVGTDLFVEWRHHTLPSKEVDVGGMLFGIVALGVAGLGILAGFADSSSGRGSPWFCMAIGGIALLIGLVSVNSASSHRRSSLVGFQVQDSTAFQLAVRAALEEAIDLAGISKALVQELPIERGKERRVI